VEVFRGTSTVVQLFWFFYVLPFVGVRISSIACAVVVLGLGFGASGAEIVRGALNAVPRGQLEAAVARVILPQAVAMMAPPFANLGIELLKATSVVSLITVSDLTFRAEIIRGSTGATTAVFTTIRRRRRRERARRPLHRHCAAERRRLARDQRLRAGGPFQSGHDAVRRGAAEGGRRRAGRRADRPCRRRP
jgi:hypothetical protein